LHCKRRGPKEWQALFAWPPVRAQALHPPFSTACKASSHASRVCFFVSQAVLAHTGGHGAFCLQSLRSFWRTGSERPTQAKVYHTLRGFAFTCRRAEGPLRRRRTLTYKGLAPRAVRFASLA
ncbi:hypothetical protein CLOM_g24075, partial [Closterium sp. NIES-68]